MTRMILLIYFVVGIINLFGETDKVDYICIWIPLMLLLIERAINEGDL